MSSPAHDDCPSSSSTIANNDHSTELFAFRFDAIDIGCPPLPSTYAKNQYGTVPLVFRHVGDSCASWVEPPPITPVTAKGAWAKFELTTCLDTLCWIERKACHKIPASNTLWDRENRRQLHFNDRWTDMYAGVIDTGTFGVPVPQFPFINVDTGHAVLASRWMYFKKQPAKGSLGHMAIPTADLLPQRAQPYHVSETTNPHVNMFTCALMVPLPTELPSNIMKLTSHSMEWDVWFSNQLQTFSHRARPVCMCSADGACWLLYKSITEALNAFVQLCMRHDEVVAVSFQLYSAFKAAWHKAAQKWIDKSARWSPSTENISMPSASYMMQDEETAYSPLENLKLNRSVERGTLYGLTDGQPLGTLCSDGNQTPYVKVSWLQQDVVQSTVAGSSINTVAFSSPLTEYSYSDAEVEPLSLSTPDPCVDLDAEYGGGEDALLSSEDAVVGVVVTGQTTNGADLIDEEEPVAVGSNEPGAAQEGQPAARAAEDDFMFSNASPARVITSGGGAEPSEAMEVEVGSAYTPTLGSEANEADLINEEEPVAVGSNELAAAQFDSPVGVITSGGAAELSDAMEVEVCSGIAYTPTLASEATSSSTTHPVVQCTSPGESPRPSVTENDSDIHPEGQDIQVHGQQDLPLYFAPQLICTPFLLNAAPLDEGGQWLCQPNLAGKRLDVVILKRTKSQTTSKQLAAAGCSGYVEVPGRSLTAFDLKKRILVRVGPDAAKVSLEPELLGPLRSTVHPFYSGDDVCISRSASPMRVVIIGPDVHGGVTWSGEYALTTPNTHTAPDVVHVVFPIGSRWHGWALSFHVTSLCRSLE
ncbi:hypothetical protein R3P38DRAFT_2776742 [Favolaschia claudopus]|uniref:Uncharacterized protein n=1 Tax=Favolaschia claudopus TaxID=2862362 RepID=A0AAW0BKX6_9AGAR